MHTAFIRTLSSHPHLQTTRRRHRLGLPGHNLLSEGSTPNNWNPITLESLRDLIRAQTDSERPKVQVALLRDCRFSFDEERGAYVSFRGRTRFGKPRAMTQHALSQLLRTISSGRSVDLLEDLVQRGGNANLRLASRVMSGLVGDRHAEHSLCFRTVQRDPGLWLEDYPAAVPGRPERIVTAVLSEQYRIYDDAEFMTDLVEQIPNNMQLKVISAWRGADGLRVRATLGDVKDALEVAVPVPMIEFRNSEVGLSSAMLRGGLYTLVCTNGMHSWDEWAAERWPHRGDMSRVSDEIAGAVRTVHSKATDTLGIYKTAAKQILGSDPRAIRSWLEDRQRRYRLSDRFINRTLFALEDNTTSRSGRGDFSLASVVDAITLQAQDASFSGRFELERLAGRILEGELRVAA